jgi:hypothetical protein
MFCHSGVIDTTVKKIGDFKVNFLREFEAIFKKALTRASGGLGEVGRVPLTRGLRLQ